MLSLSCPLHPYKLVIPSPGLHPLSPASCYPSEIPALPPTRAAGNLPPGRPWLPELLSEIQMATLLPSCPPPPTGGWDFSPKYRWHSVCPPGASWALPRALFLASSLTSDHQRCHPGPCLQLPSPSNLLHSYGFNHQAHSRNALISLPGSHLSVTLVLSLCAKYPVDTSY